VVYDYITTTIKNILDVIKEIIDNILEKVEEIYNILTNPEKFADFLLNALEKIW